MRHDRAVWLPDSKREDGTPLAAGTYDVWSCLDNPGHFAMEPYERAYAAGYHTGWRYWRLADRFTPLPVPLGVFIGGAPSTRGKLPPPGVRWLQGGQGHLIVPYERTEAVCDNGLQPPCPYERHRCGIYAVKERAHSDGSSTLAVSLPSTHLEHDGTRLGGGRVLGKVALWGRVWEHQWGYRSQYAYPLALAAGPHMSQHGLDLLEQLADRYGVPVI